MFKYGEHHSDVILREDMNNRKDIYIRVSLLPTCRPSIVWLAIHYIYIFFLNCTYEPDATYIEVF